jgi:hypothetical protein
MNFRTPLIAAALTSLMISHASAESAKVPALPESRAEVFTYDTA